MAHHIDTKKTLETLVSFETASANAKSLYLDLQIAANGAGPESTPETIGISLLMFGEIRTNRASKGNAKKALGNFAIRSLLGTKNP